MNEQERILRSIRTALWTLVGFAGVAAIGIAIFFGVGAFICFDDDDSDNLQTIVVASTNITFMSARFDAAYLDSGSIRSPILPSRRRSQFTSLSLHASSPLGSRGRPSSSCSTTPWRHAEREQV